jgi:hypothetical protein
MFFHGCHSGQILSKDKNSFEMDIKSPQKVLHIFSRALENFSSFGFVEGRLVCWAKPNVLKCAAAKKKLKMRVGKNFKNIQVGLSVGSLFSVSLLKNAFKSVNLNCQVAKSPFSVVTFRVALSFYAWA